MSQGLGFYSGLLEGTTALGELQLKKDELALRRSDSAYKRDIGEREYADSHASNLQKLSQSKESHAADLKQSENVSRGSDQDYAIKSQKMSSDEAERALMAKSFPSQEFDKNVKQDYNSNNAMSNKLIDAGRKMMSINLEKGLALMKEGEAMQHKGVEDQLKATQIYAARHEAIAMIANSVSDQESLNTAVEETAKAGGSIPKQFRVWNKETQSFLQSQAKGSKSAKQDLELDLRVKASELAVKKEERMADTAKNESLRKEKKDAALRNNTGKVYKEPKFEDVAQTVLDLTSKSEDFGDLKPADRRQAALDYGRRAYEHQKEGISDPTLAYAMAEEEILSRVVEGSYNGFSEELKSQSIEEKQASQYPNAPKVGTAKGDYTYIGGDPASEKSWKKKTNWLGF